MFKLIEVAQTVTFDAAQNTRSTKVLIPWTTVVVVALLGPFVVSGFRTSNKTATVTPLRAVPTDDVASVDKKTEE